MILPFKKYKKQLFIRGGHTIPVFIGKSKIFKEILYKYVYKKIDYYHQLYNYGAKECHYNGNVINLPNGVDTKIFIQRIKIFRINFYLLED